VESEITDWTRYANVKNNRRNRRTHGHE
jgi:hypothetical protein